MMQLHDSESEQLLMRQVNVTARLKAAQVVTNERMELRRAWWYVSDEQRGSC